MQLNPLSGSGTVLVERYRLQERLSGPDPVQGTLWRAVDEMAGDLPVAIREIETSAVQERLKGVWPQLQSLLHPQLPRCGELFELDGVLWLVRDWQDGVACDVLLRQRSCGAGEVIQLLHQILPVLAVLHGQGLVHGDLNPRHVLRRRSDGLMVLLHGGRLQRQGVTEQAAAWRDLHDLGGTALALLGGTAGEDVRWPEGLESEPGFREVLERLLSKAPERRFNEASDVLKALEAVALPAEPPVVPRTSRALAREQGAEGRLWPVVIALGLSALAGSAIGWFLLPRSSNSGRALRTPPDQGAQPSAVSLPPGGLDQREQLFSRLRALQVDRNWFLQLVDASQLPSELLENSPLRRDWTELAEEWVARIEQLPPAIRTRLGRLRNGDWEQPRQALQRQGIHPRVVEHLVSAAAQALLPGDAPGRKPVEPFRQLWIAAAMQSLDDVEIERITARPLDQTATSFRIPAVGARLVLVEVPAADVLALGISGTPLMQMMVFSANGNVVEQRGPLRQVQIPGQEGSPLQVLVTNEGVSAGAFTLSSRVDPLDQ